MNRIRLFVLRRAIRVLWIASVARRLLAKALARVEARLSLPFRGLPIGIDVLDGMARAQEMRRTVLSLRNPLRLAVGGFLRGDLSRRSWLVEAIKRLPTGNHISYVLHYRDDSGRVKKLLARDPLRGLRPLPDAPERRCCRSSVMAAYHGDSDVTPEIKQVSATFDESEVCVRALDLYLKSVRGVGIVDSPLVVTNARLVDRVFVISSRAPAG